MIYLIYSEENDKIKIGYSVDPLKRFGAIQTNHWAELKLIHTEEGTLEEEQFIHQSLKAYNIRGEWYNLNEIEHLLSYYLNTWGKHTTVETGVVPVKEVTIKTSLTYSELIDVYNKNKNLADLEEYEPSEDYYRIIKQSVEMYGKVWKDYTYASKMIENFITEEDLKDLTYSLKKNFELNRTYSTKQVKLVLGSLYNQYGITTTPKAIDLNKFGKTKLITNAPRGIQLLQFYN